jgi:hypothetical protein
VGKHNPFKAVSIAFNVELAEQDGAGASLFSRAAAQLENAAASALSIAHRSASWLTRKTVTATHQWSMRLNEDDDTVSIASTLFLRLLGGLSTTIDQDHVGGKVGYSHGGLGFLFFVADPEQPLDGNLRATQIRISSAKTAGEFDVHRPFVISITWGNGKLHSVCKTLS